MKKCFVLFLSVLLTVSFAGCGDNSGSSINDSSSAEETTAAEPSISETEASRRSDTSVKQKLEELNLQTVPYEDMDGSDCRFYGFSYFILEPEITYNTEMDCWTAYYSDVYIDVEHIFGGVSPCYGTCLKFSATVDVYSNGDTEIRRFNYEQLEGMAMDYE